MNPLKDDCPPDSTLTALIRGLSLRTSEETKIDGLTACCCPFNVFNVCFQEENEKKALKEPSDTEPASAERYLTLYIKYFFFPF